MKTFKEIKDLEKRAREVIDSYWHYSWHWPQTEHGSLTLAGWRRALKDACALRTDRERHAEKLRKIEEEISELIVELDLVT